MREYIKLSKDRYLVKDSCGIIVSEKDVLKEQEAKNGDTESDTKQKTKSTKKADHSTESK